MMRRLSIFTAVCITALLLSRTLMSGEFSTGDLTPGPFTALDSALGTWFAPEETAAVITPPNQERRSLHYWGVPGQYLTLELAEPQEVDQIDFDVERWTSAPPFSLTAEVRSDGQWSVIHRWDGQTPVGFNRVYSAAVGKKIDALRFELQSKEKLGVMIHALALVPKGPMTVVEMKPALDEPAEPILIAQDGKTRVVNLQTVEIKTTGRENPIPIDEVTLELENAPSLANVEFCLNDQVIEKIAAPIEGKNVIALGGKQVTLTGPRDRLTFRASASASAAVDQTVRVRFASVTLGEKTVSWDYAPLEYRFGVLLRDCGWDGAAAYRIPGLVISNKGTLLAVYDIRHNNHNDLPDDIDIGLSRSFDQGKTWQPMQVAMNRHGDDERREGVGDPSILVDRQTGRIWIAALWAHDGYSTEISEPGLALGTSGQLDVVYSDDDGATWSEPRSITAEAAPGKDWRILFQGPGMGITLRDGTLVFPAQFIDKDRVWYSTLVSSCDHGKTWRAAAGARPMTCEAQIVELDDGEIMISMRNFKEKARSVAVTKDLGVTWTEHLTSLKALDDPICQASLLRVFSTKDGDTRNLLAFCNPNSPSNRVDMTVQFSDDEGMTWKNPILLYKPYGYGYSCMARIDSKTLGVLYETCGGLIFQRVPIPE